MDWQGLSQLVATAVFIWYLRKDSKDDFVRLEARLESSRKETDAIINAIREDMKDFHGRLCAIEEKYRQVK
jgi:hypothetical protein